MSLSKQLTPSIYHRLAFGTAYGLTDVGTVRPANEDNFLIDAGLALAAVADGMGGHDAGEVAAHTTLCAIRAALAAVGPCLDGNEDDDEDASAIIAAHCAVAHANAEVYGANLRAGRTEGEGMGTTLTGFWQPRAGGSLVVFHVGDSRLYRLRDGELALLTRDQTMYQRALDAGVTEDYPPRNLLLQAVGASAVVAPDVHVTDLQAGDAILLCSDGLHGSVPHAALAHALAGVAARTESLAGCCEALVALAKAHGSRDNITVVLALAEA